MLDTAIFPFHSWTIIGTKPLCDHLQLDRCAFNMRVYRGKGPAAVPSHWLRGRHVGFYGWAVRQWLGDERTTAEIIRAEVAREVGEFILEDNDDVVWIYAQVRAEETDTVTAGVQLSRIGIKEHKKCTWETGLQGLAP